MTENQIQARKLRLLKYLTQAEAISESSGVKEIVTLSEHLKISSSELHSLCKFLSDAGLIKYLGLAGFWEVGDKVTNIWLTDRGLKEALEIENKASARVAQLPSFFLVALVLSVLLPVLVFWATKDLLVTSFIFFIAILLFSLIGGFYLRQQKALSEKSFLQLVGMVIKQLPQLFKSKID